MDENELMGNSSEVKPVELEKKEEQPQTDAPAEQPQTDAKAEQPKAVEPADKPKPNANTEKKQTGEPADKPQTTKQINYNTNYNTNYSKNKGGKGCLFWGLIALGIFITLNGFIIFGIAAAFSSADTVEEADTVYGDYVETIYIEGIIASDNVNGYGVATGYQHQWTLDELDYLINDDKNKGLILYINSGGGGTYESDEMYLALKKYKEETGRPIYAYYAQTAASGALYLSMAADEIYANRMTMTGSIGVMINSYDATGLMDKLGIKDITIKSGKNKNMLSPTAGTTQEEIDILQSMINESYDIFVGIVSEERGIPLEKAKQIADGRVYSAQQAKALGLIDDIMSHDDFMDMLKGKAEFEDCEFIDAQYTDDSFMSLFFSKLPEIETKSEASLLYDIMKKSSNTQLEYSINGELE
ncbi:MAG: signal peptide peptidase SppA [Lachnospiraceae bacterium]|nr:signal peptide peptidase SppA [Lachnospiraceae bacterium]